MSFLLGFALQYMTLYLLRRNGLLFDIDRIVLRVQATRVDLSDLSERGTRLLATRKALEPSPASQLHGEIDD